MVLIGLVIVTHGALALELKLATEHVLGSLEQFETVCIGADDDLEQAANLVHETVKKVQSDDGVLLFTDMFGGTPSNLAISLLDHENIEVIAGVNLPMLIKVCEARLGIVHEDEKLSLETIAKLAKKSGQYYIAIASEVIAGDLDE